MTGTRARGFLAAAATGVAFGVGALVLQRWIAQTFQTALLLVALWFVLVAVFGILLARRRSGALAPVIATLALIAIGSAGIAYWTAFRKDEVDERVVMAMTSADGAELEAALAGGSEPREPKPSGPRKLVSGEVVGQDGHSGEGVATVVEDGGERLLTLTEFDVDAGPDVNVYLSESAEGIDGAVELGDLKGERGDQQYPVPADLDLRRYDNVVLYCIPFTTRIATAGLG